MMSLLMAYYGLLKPIYSVKSLFRRIYSRRDHLSRIHDYYIILYYITLHYITLRYVTLRYVTLRYVTLCYVMLCYVIIVYIILYIRIIIYLPDRSLAKLRKVLRIFFQKKPAAELYQDLVNTCQQPKESAQQFLLCLLDFHNKVILASQDEESQFEYSLKLVQNIFLKSLETGLRDEGLVTNLRPHLRLAEVSDEELMKVVNELASKQA